MSKIVMALCTLAFVGLSVAIVLGWISVSPRNLFEDTPVGSDFRVGLAGVFYWKL